ncbi:MAG: pirin family protein [Candidatus Lokiarchaeota archaeon]|nr:pirin family protein [Candidatus Lokiarchaeota archaeon]
MREERSIQSIKKPRTALEGAGVKIARVFGFADTKLMDPFLLLDEFGSEKPSEFEKGFPWHPHRGIETITYMFEGKARHRDSTGGKGVIEPGAIQWMTAGSGIIHEEMPESDTGTVRGLQLWLNLPAKEKMTPPKYRGYKASEFPEVTTSEGARIKIIAGSVNGVRGPIRGIKTEPEYLDIFLPEGCEITHSTNPLHKVFAYIMEGSGTFSSDNDMPIESQSLVLYKSGSYVTIRAEDSSLRFVLVSAMPLGEPIAWQGPIVMNTEKELQTAFREYREGTFIKHT